MGHLVAVIYFLMFAVVFVGKLYLSYLYALRHTYQEELFVPEIPDEGIRFELSKVRAVAFSLAGGIISVMFFFFLFKFYDPSDSLSMGFFWMIFDIYFPVVFIITLAAVKYFRSYLHIFPEGFQCRGAFGAKWYPKERIEGVYRTSELIFVRLKGKRLPVIIENGYGDSNLIFGLISGIAGSW